MLTPPTPQSTQSSTPVQLTPSRLHALRFWLGVVMRNLSSDCPYVSILMLETMNWFLWHCTASAVPQYLRTPLFKGSRTMLKRLDEDWYKWKFNDGEGGKGHMRQQLSGLQYLMGTDVAMQALGVRTLIAAPWDVYIVRTPLLNTVRMSLPGFAWLCSLLSKRPGPYQPLQQAACWLAQTSACAHAGHATLAHAPGRQCALAAQHRRVRLQRAPRHRPARVRVWRRARAARVQQHHYQPAHRRARRQALRPSARGGALRAAGLARACRHNPAVPREEADKTGVAPTPKLVEIRTHGLHHLGDAAADLQAALVRQAARGEAKAGDPVPVVLIEAISGGLAMGHAAAHVEMRRYFGGGDLLTAACWYQRRRQATRRPWPRCLA
jgi:hypothetical protein